MDFRQQRSLGRTGLMVGRLGIGASYGVPADAIEMAFHEFGINYLYWGSMRRPGMRDAIKHLAPQHREQLVIAFQSYDRTGFFMGRRHERGLRMLGIERADVLILGWHNKPPAPRIIDAAMKLKSTGKVRFIALSGHHRPLFGRLIKTGELPIDIFMIRYNAAHRGAETEIFPFLPQENRPGITCYTATRWGSLLDPKKMPGGELPLTAADCYRFVLSHPDIDLCMTGPANRAQLEQGLRALDRGPLDDTELARAKRIGDAVRQRALMGK